MSDRMKALLILSIYILMACLSSLHCHILGFGIDYDLGTGNFIITTLSFVLALLLQIPSSRLALFIFLMPVSTALVFSWAELLGEFHSGNPQKGWGLLWLILSFIFSLIGFLGGLGVRKLVARKTKRVKSD